jgi:hypothetical protein
MGRMVFIALTRKSLSVNIAIYVHDDMWINGTFEKLQKQTKRKQRTYSHKEKKKK